MGKRFPPAQDKAKDGSATATSTSAGCAAQQALTGARTTDNWCLNETRGGFVAVWDKPVLGQYVVIFARPITKGADAWGTAAISINDGIAAPLLGMSNQKVAVVALRHAAKIQKLAIVINGAQHPGIAKVEIH